MQSSFTNLRMSAQTMYAQTLDVCLLLEGQYLGGATSKDLHEQKASLTPFVRAAIALGCVQMPAKHFKALVRLSRQGFFRAGGAISGAVAAHIYGNMMGIRWQGGLMKNLGNCPTQACMVGPPDIGVRCPELSGKVNRGRFHDFILEDVQQAVVINGSNFVLANVVHPARFILAHLAEHTSKSHVAIAQAVADVVMDHRPFDLEQAYQKFSHLYPHDAICVKKRCAQIICWTK